MNERSWTFWFWLLAWGTTGALVALSVWPPLWWLGTLVGGAGAYIFYDAGAVLAATRRALSRERLVRLTVRIVRGTPGTCVRVSVEIGRVTAVIVFGLLFCGIPGALIWSFFSWFLPQNIPGIETNLSDLIMAMVACFFIGALINCLVLVAATDYSYNGEKLFFFAQPVMLILALLVYFALPELVLALIIAAACLVVVVLMRVTPRVFRAVHSDARLVYGLSAALGAAVGYWCGSAPIGGLAALGIGHLEFRLVRRWLLPAALVQSGK